MAHWLRLPDAGSLAEGDAKEAHLRISFTREDSGLADACSLCASMTLASTEVNAALSPHKTVRFADDCGLELATVRVMTEPSDYPPMISPSVSWTLHLLVTCLVSTIFS